MTSHPTPGPTQSQILEAYTTLHQLGPDWGGAIILSLGLNSRARALSFAASIAGAVSLSIDNDPAHLREAIRTGACDFVVNTLDEALRAMKNEVRKRAPLSVGLQTDLFAAITELIDRGVRVSDIRHKSPISDWRGGWEPGLEANRSDHASLADFTDPDGNQWVLQERGFHR